MAEGELSRRELVAGLASEHFVGAMPQRLSASRTRIMVQGRPQDTGSTYKVSNIMPALDKLGGVRKMRCREPYRGTPGWNTYVGLGRAGVKFCFTLSGREIGITIADLRAFLALAPGSVWAIEFPNEPDLNPLLYKGVRDRRLAFRSGDAPAFMAFISDFSATLKADVVLRQIPLIAGNDFMQSEQRPFASFGNAHIYPRPGTSIPDRLARFGAQITAGGFRQGVITEWGRTTGGDEKNMTSPPVSLAMQGELLASDVRSALDSAFVHTIGLYELFSWGGTREINNFGLFNADLTPRPVVSQIRQLLV